MMNDSKLFLQRTNKETSKLCVERAEARTEKKHSACLQ